MCVCLFEFALRVRHFSTACVPNSSGDWFGMRLIAVRPGVLSVRSVRLVRALRVLVRVFGVLGVCVCLACAEMCVLLCACTMQHGNATLVDFLWRAQRKQHRRHPTTREQRPHKMPCLLPLAARREKTEVVNTLLRLKCPADQQPSGGRGHATALCVCVFHSLCVGSCYPSTVSSLPAPSSFIRLFARETVRSTDHSNNANKRQCHDNSPR